MSLNKFLSDAKELRLAKLVMLIGIVILCMSPYFFTRSVFWDKLDFSQTGQIGDTIGGITAPIANLMGALLVYLALRAQIKANQLVQDQLSTQYKIDEINLLYKNLKEDIDSFSYISLHSSDFGKGQYLTGAEAIYQLFEDFYCDNCHLDEQELKTNPKITQLTGILEICDALLEKISQSNVPNKEILHTLACHQFRYRVFPRLNFEGEQLEKHFCSTCNRDHGLPEKMAILIKELDKCTR